MVCLCPFIMTSLRNYDKICLFCRNEFIAQKRTTKYCGHSCASRAYKVNKRNEVLIEVNFEEFVKNQLNIHTEALNQIQFTISQLIQTNRIIKAEFIPVEDYCNLKGISRKTLSRWIKENKVEVKQLSTRKFLIKS